MTIESNPNEGLRRSFGFLPIYQAAILLLACLLFGLALGTSGREVGSEPANWMLGILVVWAALVAAGLFDRGGKRLGLRLVGDFLCGLSMVGVSGGVESLFLPLLCVQVLASSTMLGRRQSFLLASLATIFLACLSVFSLVAETGAEVARAGHEAAGARVMYVVCWLIGQSFALHLMAFLGVGLMTGMRSVMSINDLIVRNIGEGLVAMDHRGRILLMNQEALRILNYPPDCPWQGLLPGEVLRRAEDAPILSAFHRRTRDVLLEWKGARDQSFPLSIRVRELSGVRKQKDNVWVALLRDETLEQRAARAEAKVKLLEELEDMARGLAHEIRNPLASIRGCVQELSRGRLSKAQADHLSSIVLKESDRLDRIVSEFMEYCGSHPTRKDTFPLLPLIREVVDSLELRPDAHGLRFEVDYDGDSEPCIIGERELIYRVFLNLGVNAVEASEPPGTIRFSIDAGKPDGWDVAVVDQGCGMDAQTLQHAFHPFFTTKTREGGLGLSIVEKIVNSHGGNIEVTSKPGEGSCFRVWFPRAREREQQKQLATTLAGASE